MRQKMLSEMLKERFGTPYYNLADPADPESMSEEELLSL